MREDEANEIKKTKLIGLDAVRNKINSLKHDKEYEWDLLPVSSETANKLLQGEFDTFEELKNTYFDPYLSNIEILYRKVENINKERDVYIIETIFIDE